MALTWLPATAHDGDAMLNSSLQEAGDRVPKRGLGSHGTVQSMSRSIVVVVAIRPPAQGVAEEQVPHALRGQGGIQFPPVEVRCEGRVGIRPDIDKELDPLR